MAALGYPDISTNTLGQIVVAFPAFFAQRKQIFVRLSNDYGVNWNTTERVTAGDYPCDNPAVAIDEKGNIVVIYETLLDGYIHQFYETHRFATESSWSAPIRIDDADLTLTAVEHPTNSALNCFEDSFEVAFVAGEPPGWTKNGTAVAARDILITYAGTYALKLTNVDSSNRLLRYFNPGESTSDNKYLLFAALYATSGTAIAKFELQDYNLVDDETVVFETTETGTWQYYYKIVDNPYIEHDSSKTNRIELYANSTSDVVYFDKVGVLRIDSDIFPQQYPNILVDDDFKKGHVNILYGKDTTEVMDLYIKTHNTDGGANITDDVQSLRISRDKEFKTGKYGAGDFSMTLSNTEGIYTNEKNDSPFFKRLKSGIEVNIELGVREHVSGTLLDSANWSEELFPSIIGVASKFSQNSKNELFTMSGRDRADTFMSYRNFTSELYESKQALELIEELTNEDKSDPYRPSIELSGDTSQQTLTVWEKPIISATGTSSGDAGSNVLTEKVINTFDVKVHHADVNFFNSAWIDRSGSVNYLWSISGRRGTDTGTVGKLYLDKWSNWEVEDSTPVHESGLDITSAFPNWDELPYEYVSGYFRLSGQNKHLSVSPYDSDHDCVWVLYFHREYSVNAWVDIAQYAFKTNTYTHRFRLTTNGSDIPCGDSGGAIMYDKENNKLWYGWKGGECVTPVDDPIFGFFDVSSGGVLSNHSSRVITFPGGYMAYQFMMNGVKIKEYFYIGAGYQGGSPDYINCKMFYAINFNEMYTLYNNLMDKPHFHIDSALCLVQGPSSSANTYMFGSKDCGTGETFFNNSTTQKKPIKSFDYSDDFVYLFCGDLAASGFDYTTISNGFEVRKLASLLYTLPHTNIMTADHTISEGYEDNDTAWKWFSIEKLTVENDDLDEEYQDCLHYCMYPVSGTKDLIGDSCMISGMPTIPGDDYHINLETGEFKAGYLFDKKNTFNASYDYAYAVPYAWFEDTSLWDSIQEVASAGDFVCYVNEEGKLAFKDRFRFYYPKMSDYETYLKSDDTWNNQPSCYEFEDKDGNAITNIIPGLEFVVSMNPDKINGKYTVYKRRSYKTNSKAYIGIYGDYDIDYDNGLIAWHSGSTIKEDARVMIYFYNKDYLFDFSYDSNILNLNYEWGSESVINRATVKGERYYPSESPVSIREVYVVDKGDRVVNTKFASIKQLSVGSGATDIDQKQWDAYLQQWKDQTGDPNIDYEFRTKLIGDTAKSREAGKALKLRVIPCKEPGSWASGSSAAAIPDDAWVGQGYKINWSSDGDTGVISQPGGGVSQLNVTGVALDADGLRIDVDHLERTDKNYFIQVEIEGYTLTRVGKITALHEDYASIKKYYTKSFELENKFISDMEMAKFRARMLVHYLSEEMPKVTIEVLGSPFIELEDVVSVKDTNSGLAGDYFEVIGISHNITKGKFTTSLKLRKICEVTTHNLGYANPIIRTQLATGAEGFIDKVALPTETFVEQSEGFNK